MQVQGSRRYRILSLAYTIYGLLITYPLIFLSIYVYHLGGYLASALIYASTAIAIGIAPIFIAPFSDRSGYRLKYATFALLIGSSILLSSAFLNYFWIELFAIIASSALIQIGQPLFISYETERNKMTGSSVGKVFLFINLGYFLGSILFGLAIDLLGFNLTTIIASATGISIAIAFLNFKEERLFSENPVKINYFDAFKLKDQFGLLSSMSVLAAAVFFSIVPAYYVYSLKGGVLDWGLVNAISTITGIFASPFVGRLVDKFGIKKVILIGLLYYPIYYSSVFLYPDLILFAVFYVMPFWLFLWIPLFSYSAEKSLIYERAIEVSRMNFLIGIFRTIGGLMGGFIIEALGQQLFFISIISLSLMIISIILLIKENRKR